MFTSGYLIYDNESKNPVVTEQGYSGVRLDRLRPSPCTQHALKPRNWAAIVSVFLHILQRSPRY